MNLKGSIFRHRHPRGTKRLNLFFCSLRPSRVSRSEAPTKDEGGRLTCIGAFFCLFSVKRFLNRRMRFPSSIPFGKKISVCGVD